MALKEQLSEFLIPFYTLSSPTDTPLNTDSFPDSRYYKTDTKDVFLVITIIAVFALLRDFFRLAVFEPFARWKLSRDLKSSYRKRNGKSNGSAVNGNGNGHAKSPFTKAERRTMRHKVFRFAEQGWSMVYYPVQWSFGLYVHRHLPTKVLAPVDVWIGYPHTALAAPIKIYYLTQLAFYLHQILVLNAEARRKDHWQMMAHHIITVFLLWASYYYNFTRIGCLCTLLMDMCDIFLPLAKMLRYLNLPQIYPDLTFVAFMVSWFITRHVLFVLAIKSTIIDLPRILPFDWDPERGSYITKGSHAMFYICLIALEIIQIFWFGLIIRVAYKVVTGGGASDVRSDEEGENDEDEDDKED